MRNKRGFTTIEMLCALLVLVLASGAMVLEIVFASNTYKESVDVSQAQMLCSTLVNTVKQELREASAVTTDAEGNLVSFYCADYGEGMFTTDAQSGRILFNESEVLSTGAYTNALRAKVELSYDETQSLFTAIITISSPQNSTLASSRFTVTPMSA